MSWGMQYWDLFFLLRGGIERLMATTLPFAMLAFTLVQHLRLTGVPRNGTVHGPQNGGIPQGYSSVTYNMLRNEDSKIFLD